MLGGWPERTPNDGATFPRYSYVLNENPSLTLSGSSLHEPESAPTQPRTQPPTHEPTNPRTHPRTHEPPTDPRTHEPANLRTAPTNPRIHEPTAPPPTPNPATNPGRAQAMTPLYTAGPKSIKIHVKNLKVYSVNSRKRQRRVFVVWVIYRGKVAPSFSVRSGQPVKIIRKIIRNRF